MITSVSASSVFVQYNFSFKASTNIPIQPPQCLYNFSAGLYRPANHQQISQGCIARPFTLYSQQRLVPASSRISAGFMRLGNPSSQTSIYHNKSSQPPQKNSTPKQIFNHFRPCIQFFKFFSRTEVDLTITFIFCLFVFFH